MSNQSKPLTEGLSQENRSIDASQRLASLLTRLLPANVSIAVELHRVGRSLRAWVVVEDEKGGHLIHTESHESLAGALAEAVEHAVSVCLHPHYGWQDVIEHGDQIVHPPGTTLADFAFNGAR